MYNSFAPAVMLACAVVLASLCDFCSHGQYSLYNCDLTINVNHCMGVAMLLHASGMSICMPQKLSSLYSIMASGLQGLELGVPPIQPHQST